MQGTLTFSILSSARSISRETPTTRAGTMLVLVERMDCSEPSLALLEDNTTWTTCAPETTWALVMM